MRPAYRCSSRHGGDKSYELARTPQGERAHGVTLVFDASTPIAISDIRRPDLFDQLVDLGYTLAVPSHVERRI